jgi:hypothetical protein
MGRDSQSYSLICISEKQKYFCKRGWTRQANHVTGPLTDLPDEAKSVRGKRHANSQIKRPRCRRGL